MSHIYQHKTLRRPINSRKNKSIGEIAVSRKSNINIADKTSISQWNVHLSTMTKVLRSMVLNNNKDSTIPERKTNTWKSRSTNRSAIIIQGQRANNHKDFNISPPKTKTPSYA
jgi:hypothetical protein